MGCESGTEAFHMLHIGLTLRVALDVWHATVHALSAAFTHFAGVCLFPNKRAIEQVLHAVCFELFQILPGRISLAFSWLGSS